MSAFFKNWKCVREGKAIFPPHQLRKRGNRERRGGWQYFPLINSKNEGLKREEGVQYSPLINSKNEGLEREEGGGNIPP